MLEQSSGITQVLLSILFFPTYFQNEFITFAWGAQDPFWLMALKRIFLLLPVFAFLLGCWASMASLLTIVVRHKRTEFTTAIMVTWWDLGRAILSFWGGTLRFVLTLTMSIFATAKVLLFGVWILIQDILLIPFRVLLQLGSGIVRPGVPWIAVALTLVWCLFEAGVFTYVTSPLVRDTLSNLTGDDLSEGFIRIPLYLFMAFIVLASYAVLSTWTETVRKRDVPNMIKIGAIELVAMFVEIVFLYREFVDSLVPWFAQHTSDGFELGIAGTLGISALTWLGIRGMSWFLFAKHGTPTIMAIIQGTGLKSRNQSKSSIAKDTFGFTHDFVAQLKKELDWTRSKGDELLGAFILPPLQIVAASINFLSLFVLSNHLFKIPFGSVSEVLDTKTLMDKVYKKAS